MHIVCRFRPVVIIEYIFALLILLQTNSVFDMTVDHLGSISRLTVLACCILLLFIKKITRSNIYAVMFFIVYFIIFGGANVLGGSYTGTYVLYTLTFLGMYLYISSSENKKSLFVCIENIMLILGVLSLFFWLFGSVLGIIYPTGTRLVQWGNIKDVPSYFNVYFEAQLENYFGWDLYRNTAVFTEAPMYAVNLIIANVIELFMRENISKMRLGILFACMLSTISFSGIAILALCLFIRFFDFSKIEKNTLFKIGIFAFTISIALFFVAPIFFNKISSSISRMDDYMAGFLTWKENLIFGTGFYENTRIISNMSSFRLYNTGFSNSIMRMLAQSGIYLFLLYFIPFTKAIKIGMKSDKQMLKAALILALVYCVLLCTYSYNILIFVAYMWSVGFNLSLNKRKNSNYTAELLQT